MCSRVHLNKVMEDQKRFCTHTCALDDSKAQELPGSRSPRLLHRSGAAQRLMLHRMMPNPHRALGVGQWGKNFGANKINLRAWLRSVRYISCRVHVRVAVE